MIFSIDHCSDKQSEFIQHRTICKHKTTVLKYLSERFTYYSSEEWRKSLVAGRIFLNGHLIYEDIDIFPNDTLLCLIDKVEAVEPPIDPNYNVLFEDDYVLLVNKSGDIPVHPSGRYRKNTLLTILEADLACKLYPCHRLDRETSGISLFAKDSKAGQNISKQFQDRKIEKEYRVFVYGDFPEQIRLEGFIESDLKSTIRKKKCLNQDVMKIESENKTVNLPSNYAITDFIKLSFSNGISQLAAFPLTGRIHQIRASLYSAGFPVLGDKIYGRDESIFLQFIDSGWKDEFTEILGHTRQALHAYRLEFEHPFSGEKVKIISPIPSDLNF